MLPLRAISAFVLKRLAAGVLAYLVEKIGASDGT
jgi:hypothetical protein